MGFYSHLCARGDIPWWLVAQGLVSFYSHLCVRGDVLRYGVSWVRAFVSIHTSVWEVTYFWYNFLWGAGVSIHTSAREVTISKPERSADDMFLFTPLRERWRLSSIASVFMVCFYSHLCARGDDFLSKLAPCQTVSIHTSAWEVTKKRSITSESCRFHSHLCVRGDRKMQRILRHNSFPFTPLRERWQQKHIRIIVKARPWIS